MLQNHQDYVIKNGSAAVGDGDEQTYKQQNQVVIPAVPLPAPQIPYARLMIISWMAELARWDPSPDASHWSRKPMRPSAEA